MGDFNNDEGYPGRKKVWDAFINGDPNSFKSLFEFYYGEMYGYGLKLCNNSELVKDCIQDLFKTIWERSEKLDHIKSPNVYLFVSLRRKILKRVRESKKNRINISDVEEASFACFGNEDIIITNEIKHKNKQKLKEALNQLSNRQREIIYLHFYNGMSYGEIEKILSINRQSVRNHVYRGMETLRMLLDNEILKLVISLTIVFVFMI